MPEQAMTEQEMREAKVPSLDSLKDVTEYIDSLVERPHGYGTCVYAMSMVATAAYNYVARKLHVTGFQASCADMDILARTRGWRWGRILNYEDLLYPQYCDEEHFPTWRRIINENVDELAKRAKEMLAERTGASPAVIAHWKWLAALPGKTDISFGGQDAR